jgi:hypothetical protein
VGNSHNQDVRTTDEETRAIPVMSRRQCTDAATERMLMTRSGFLSTCSTRSMKRFGNAITIASACMAPYRVGFHIREVLSSAATHTTITGSFDSAYTMSGTLTMTGGDAPTGWKMTDTEEAKWLGPCTADQKPGDIIWSNGCKRNAYGPELPTRCTAQVGSSGRYGGYQIDVAVTAVRDPERSAPGKLAKNRR